MIRINLLPGGKARGAQVATANTQVWYVVYAVALVVWIVLLAINYLGLGDQLAQKLEQNRSLDSKITRLTQETRELDALQARLKSSQELEATVEELNRARTGPTRTVLELSKILSYDGGPTINAEKLEQLRRENPLAGFNRDWDPKRLWLERFAEDNRSCSIEGRGKTNEDVAEFLRRLALSELFDGVTLEKTEAVKDRGTGTTWIAFALKSRLAY